MVPASFDESNAVLGKPEGMTDEQCPPLSVLRVMSSDSIPLVISCWKLTKEEVEELLKTGRLWLIIYGMTMPPVALTVNKPWKSN